MRKICFWAALCLVVFGHGRAMAHDGVIVISGDVNESTCNITGGGGATGSANSITVTLPTISTSALQIQGHAGDTPFSLVLTGSTCTNGKMVSLWVESTTPSSITPTGTLSNLYPNGGNGFAGGVEVELINPANGNRINLAVNTPIDSGNNSVVTTSNQPVATIDNHTATLNYVARYYNPRIGTMTPGQVMTYIAFALQYN